MRLTVIGTGYLGATHAACLADLGHEVLGVDIDAQKVAALSRGEVPFFEPGLTDVLDRALASGRLRFTTSLAEAGAFADVHFLCVGTPEQPGQYAVDMRQVSSAVTGLAPHLGDGALLVGKSTVPVGTAGDIARLIAPARLAWNPEFLREGHAVADTVRPDRLVFGVADPRDEAVLREVYADAIAADVPVIVCDFATAELVKAAANAFLATKISFINAMAEVCEVTGADVTVLADALGHDPRIGRRFLGAGLGFGGGCLPKDLRGFMARAGELGVDQAVTFLREIDQINLRRRRHAVDLARTAVGGRFRDTVVAVWGAAFKPDSDDVRDSPALDVAAAIHLEGADVRVHDPQAMRNARELFPTLDYADSPERAADGAHVVLHLTEWQEYRDVDPAKIAEVVTQPYIIDGRNTLDPQVWRAAGWTYRALGRPRA